MFDIIIKNGTVIDGSGNPGIKADLGIKQQKIEAIGDLSDAQGSNIVDATGLVVSPGFIDTHAHSDGVLLTDPQHASGIRQGITTEILGQDGTRRGLCTISTLSFKDSHCDRAGLF